jgi:mannose-6-phosphate isomerase-like protein (cupin superfamily)
MSKPFGQSQIIDLPRLVEECKVQWYNDDLCQVNDCKVRYGIFLGEFHWHKHDLEDEFFYVVSGKLLLDLEGETLELTPGQGYCVPIGVMHRTRAEEKTVVLMIEGDTVNPKGD